MSRAKVFGPGSVGSMTKWGQLPTRSTVKPVPQRLKDMARIHAQKLIASDTTREWRYAFCRECGVTTVLVGFDETPSARIGLWSRCKDDRDYTHHKMVTIARAEYDKLKEWPVERRLTYWAFERGT